MTDVRASAPRSSAPDPRVAFSPETGQESRIVCNWDGFAEVFREVRSKPPLQSSLGGAPTPPETTSGRELGKVCEPMN